MRFAELICGLPTFAYDKGEMCAGWGAHYTGNCRRESAQRGGSLGRRSDHLQVLDQTKPNQQPEQPNHTNSQNSQTNSHKQPTQPTARTAKLTATNSYPTNSQNSQNQPTARATEPNHQQDQPNPLTDRTAKANL